MNPGPVGAVMVVGGGIAGIQASLDLAESGYQVYLVESSSAIGGTMPMLDKTFPTNDCSMCILSPKLVECGRHRNIKTYTLAEVDDISGDAGHFKVRLRVAPRYVDADKCKSCGECVSGCPVEVEDTFNQGLGMRKAVYKLYAQAFPNAFAIAKDGVAPCRAACPAGVNAQGYTQMIKQGKYTNAWSVIYRDNPFPAICGRICTHPCQSECQRGKIDEPVNIMYLKRVAADQAYEGVEELPLPQVLPSRKERVAIVGAGPAGLSAAYQLVLQGYSVTVFEALNVAGGMMRVGIPEYRLPKKWVDLEVGLLEKLGVEIKFGMKLGRDMQLEELRRDFDAVFLAIGAHKSTRLGIPGEDMDQVTDGISFLRRVNLNEKVAVGERVAVIGGGNTAMDCARTALRLGAKKVSIVYRRTENEITALPEEIREAREEGIEFLLLESPVAFTGENGKLTAMRCIKNRTGEVDASGRAKPVPIAGSEWELPLDMVILAVGQAPELDCVSELAAERKNVIATDDLTLSTRMEGVFAGGDAAYGPKTVVEAIGAGKRAAESIHRYLNGMDLAEGRTLRVPEEEIAVLRQKPEDVEIKHPEPAPVLPPEARTAGFSEVQGSYDLEKAREEAGRCLNCAVCSECLECVRNCLPQAIDHAMQPEFVELEVGSVIVSTGFKPFDPSSLEYYGYGRYANVLTSLEFERVLSASGPFRGHLQRPLDGKEPARIAFIQCVGSRNTRINHDYCSSVCCMYAIKEAVIAKEHSHTPLDTTIFFMDMRTYGKGFEKYYDRARLEHGVRFVRSRIYEVEEIPGSGNLKIRYADEQGQIHYEEYDMVVLAVGMEPQSQTAALAEKFQLPVNRYNFMELTPLTGVGTVREGIFVAGAASAPRDIPETVTQASAAAGEAGLILADSRHSLVSEQEFPPEKDVSGQAPRIGVWICHCGINIAGVVNVGALADYARTLPHVAYAADSLYTCSQDNLVAMREAIEKYDLNRVVVASCSPRTHRPLFQETLRNAGLNPQLFEMANIRDQCSWVHQQEPEKATGKAMDLVRMAVAKAAVRRPVAIISAGVTKAALVVGGGPSGLVAAENLAAQGFSVHLVEKEPELGGLARRIKEGLKGEDVPAFLQGLISRIGASPRIEVHTGCQVTAVSGYTGNFTTLLSDGKEIKHGVTIVATGGEVYRPDEYLYGQDPRVYTNLELQEALSSGRVKDVRTAVFIQCVGSREPKRPYCSRVCCTESVKLALQVKKENPLCQVFVLYRDIRTYGLFEDYYEKARREGVVFIRYEVDDKPAVTLGSGQIKVEVRETLLGQKLVIDADLVSLASAMAPGPDNGRLSQLFKVPLNEDGFFLEAHMKLRPVDFASDGVFMAGVAHSPKNIEENIAQAKAAAARACTILTRDRLESQGVVAVVDQSKCAACLTCVRLCPFNAPRIKNGAAEIEAVACQGCGTCAGECPNKAIALQSYQDVMQMAVVDSLFEGVV